MFSWRCVGGGRLCGPLRGRERRVAAAGFLRHAAAWALWPTGAAGATRAGGALLAALERPHGGLSGRGGGLPLRRGAHPHAGGRRAACWAAQGVWPRAPGAAGGLQGGPGGALHGAGAHGAQGGADYHGAAGELRGDEGPGAGGGARGGPRNAPRLRDVQCHGGLPGDAAGGLREDARLGLVGLAL